MTDRPVRELPMAVADRTLSPADLAAQLDRYRHLGRTALDVKEGENALVISFGADVDFGLLRETVDVKPARRLSISVENSAPGGALRVLASALRGPSESLAGR